MIIRLGLLVVFVVCVVRLLGLIIKFSEWSRVVRLFRD